MAEEYGFIDLIWKLLSGFLLYTLVYFGFRFTKGKGKLRPFDKSATIVIGAASLLFLLLWIGESLYA